MNSFLRLTCVAAVAASGLAMPKATASPPSNWSGQLIVASHFKETALINDERIKFQTKDPTDTYEVKLTWGANGNSGWHHHPGMVLVQVASGLVDVTRVIHGRCETKQYGVGSPNGSTFTEGDAMHVGTSAAGAVAYATAVIEAGAPNRIDDSPPACASDFGVRKVK
jgi:hypothetical protein